MKAFLTKYVTPSVIGMLALMIAFMGAVPVMAQEEQQEEAEKDKRPVRAPFESSILIDNQTVIVPTKGTMEFIIQHRFGVLENGMSDFLGMWAPSNIRLGMNYTLIKDVSIGIGATKFNQMVDVGVKWNFLKQTRSWSVPVGLTYYGNLGIDTRNASNFDESLHRLSYFNELIIATRFSPKLSLQLTPSISHFNAVDSLFTNDIVAMTFNGRFKVSAQSSVIFEYDQQLTTHDFVDTNTGKNLPRPNFALGIEISTSTHAFQIFLANFQEIVYQRNMVYNRNDPAEGIGQYLIGFNITRLWNF